MPAATKGVRAAGLATPTVNGGIVQDRPEERQEERQEVEEEKSKKTVAKRRRRKGRRDKDFWGEEVMTG